MSYVFFGLSQLQVLVGPALARSQAGKLANPGPWRPPEWGKPSLNAIIAPPSSDDPGAGPTVYVFDAVLRAEHIRELRRTEHPIQASPSAPVASITDHAYLLPARVTLEIGMSDAMASYQSDMWDGGPTKSISAFQQLLTLQKSRTLVTLNTRLDTYTNMVVESILPVDDAKTAHGLSATVVFSKIYLAEVKRTRSNDGANSARPQTTKATPSGVVQSLPVGNATTSQFQVPATAAATKAAIPGAGKWSSVNILRLDGVVAKTIGKFLG